MDRAMANQLASIVGGEAWERDGWIVTVEREDGSIIVFDGDSVSEYADNAEFAADRLTASLDLPLVSAGELWVLVDSKGNVYFENDELKRGWRDEEDAEHEADGVRSRTGQRYMVVQFEDVAAS